jgi:predicted Zn-dependent peptidase
MSHASRLLAFVGVAALSTACRGPSPASFGPNKVEIPVPPGAHPRSPSRVAAAPVSAPPSGVTKESPFPTVARTKLANGMGVDVVTSRALPIVQLRVVVRAGSGYGAGPGVATLTGDMLKDGGTRAMTSAELLRRIETLGADLGVSTDFDATVLSMAVTKDQLPEALDILSQVVREPRFDGDELRKLKARTVDEVAGAARSSGSYTATRIVFRELFPDHGVYGTYGLVPSEVEKVDGTAVREFHRRFYVPKATTVVLAGDVDEATAKTLVERRFGTWTGGDPPRLELTPPRPPARTRVVVAHRPKSVQSDVYVAMIAPPRKAAGWPAIRVANQVLGGGVASRLFTDVREQRSLAYRTSAQVLELAHGDQPLVVYAGTETGKTAQAVAGLLENLARMKSSPPTTAETASARRFLSDVFAIRMETIGAIANMVVVEETLGLPDGYWDAYRKQVRATDAAEAESAAKTMYTTDRAIIVVAGDADVIAPELATYGEVTVVDPEKEFKTMRTVPQVSK